MLIHIRATAGYARVAFLSSIAQPGDLAGHGVRSVLLLLLFLLASRGGEFQPDAGIDHPLTYFLVANVFFLACMVTPGGQFAGAIRAGLFTLYDAMPVHVMWRCLGSFFGNRLLSILSAAAISVLAAVLVSAPAPEPWHMRLAVAFPLLFLSAMVICLFDMAVSYLAFISPLHYGVGELKSGVCLLASGIVFPLPVLPPAVRAAAYATPFPWAVFAPARLLTQSEPIQSMPISWGTLTGLIAPLVWWGIGLLALVLAIEAVRRRAGRTFEA